ncbi:predicted integral membrane protein [Brachybacterium faecium DSM 4810]|uniref:Predicted integral membrane protein n=1 Tax=Brachybacterium faecium (strain ATCC 43885 / DSM 4810 / JCM 11609 / LMG 19847 / NBRC 14762 / NCIMB 9860 / 6-10) TaxID=446465 RepID=C7MC33_BRAFD|nr:DUF624 domain-containing protein [Brachybacterium faecium]ACU85140.1 predicted integral membrane protein [Brachybacterium faecium DSM 4810]
MPTSRSSRQPSRGPAEIPAWVLRFNETVDKVWLVVRVNLVWILLTGLGLVVLGIAPASVAAADALRASREGARVRVLVTMSGSWRRQFLGANLRLLPLLVVQAGSAAMLWIVLGGAAPSSAATVVLAGLSVISAAWSTVSAAVLVAVPRLRRQDLLVSWRLALLLSGALPGRFICLLLGLIVWIVVCTAVWPLALLVGAGTAIEGACLLFGRRVEALLSELEAARPSAP